MKISVIILNWNRPEDTIQAVESVLVQDYTQFDILVWDNASTDHSEAILTQALGNADRVTLVFADSNYGVAGGRNRAFRKTDGEIIVSLDNDAFFKKDDALACIAARMKQADDIGAVSFEVRRPDGHLMWPFSRPPPQWQQREFETIRVDGCAFATRRDIFEQVGGFAEHFSPYGAEDQHYAFKLIGEGYRVLYLPTVAVVHAFNPAGRNAAQFSMHVRNMLWMPLELFPFPMNLASALKQAYRLRQEANERSDIAAWKQGVWKALKGFRLSARRSIKYTAWRRLRKLVRKDKAERQGKEETAA